MIKLKLHSNVDLITNSSTVIFTYQESSLQPLRDMVNEMLKIFDRKETFDDIFSADVFLESTYNYLESNNCPTDVDKKELELLIDKILKKEIEKPEWMKACEEEEDSYDYYQKSTQVYLIARNEKYSELANKILKFLNSPNHEATRDG